MPSRCRPVTPAHISGTRRRAMGHPNVPIAFRKGGTAATGSVAGPEHAGPRKGALAVATAMQRYGGYVMDVAGTTMSASFELDTGAAPGSLGKVYQDAASAGTTTPWAGPWQKLRVLN